MLFGHSKCGVVIAEVGLCFSVTKVWRCHCRSRAPLSGRTKCGVVIAGAAYCRLCLLIGRGEVCERRQCYLRNIALEKLRNKICCHASFLQYRSHSSRVVASIATCTLTVAHLQDLYLTFVRAHRRVPLRAFHNSFLNQQSQQSFGGLVLYLSVPRLGHPYIQISLFSCFRSSYLLDLCDRQLFGSLQ